MGFERLIQGSGRQLVWGRSTANSSNCAIALKLWLKLRRRTSNGRGIYMDWRPRLMAGSSESHRSKWKGTSVTAIPS